ncbi:hypothetical protein Tco_0840359 [Tanacetum coccineum]|uniref:Uncharacterized protein n=1 Tax=Tanacetum coccineum TaxID=301880 RepID=A0ABQ5AVV5_9ASTR
MVNIGLRVDKPVWDNTKRVNHQKISKYPYLRNTFVPSGVLTRTGLITPVKQNEKRAVHTVSTARPVSTTRPVSTVRPFTLKIAQTGGAIRPIYPRIDNVRPRGSYSPIKRSYYTKPVFRPKDLKQDVKTFKIKNMTTAGTRAVVNTGKGKMENDLKKSKACWVWRPKLKVLDHDTKNSGSYICKQFDYVDPTGKIKTNGHQFTMSNRLQELASPKQMVLSNANGLGKDFPNPFMAGSFPKTIKQSNDPPLSRCYTLGSGENSLELMELMANCTQLGCFVRKKNREIYLELILLGITLSIVSVKLILLGQYYYCWIKFSSIKEPLRLKVYLDKSKSSEGFDEIIDFLTSSHIYYALTENPIIFVSLIEQFWETAILSTTEEGLQAISATIDGHEQLITEASLRRHLKLEDAEGISSLSNEEIFEQLAHMGFIQLLLNKQQRLLLPHTRTYPTPTLTTHDEEQQQSPLRITSSPSLSPQPTQPSPSPEPIQPTHEAEETASMPHDLPLHVVHSYGSAEGSMQQHDLMVLVNKLNDRIDGLEKDLQPTKKIYSTALTKLELRVKKLEYKLKSGKARRKAKIVLSDDEEIAEDSSKQGKKISQIDEDPTISLVQDEGISWIPQEEEVYEKPSDETKLIVQEETPTKIIEEHGSGEKGEMEISTASPPKVTKVSSAEAHVYTRSAKDKGKAIMKEPATPKKVKKRTQVQLSMDEEQLDERQEVPIEATQSKGIDWNDPSVLRYHVLKNKPVSIAQARRNMITYLKNQGGYKESYFKRMSYNDIRPIFERKAIGTRRKTLSRRRASDKQVEDSSKRQKKEKESDDFEQEKEDLRMWLSVLKDEEKSMTLEFLSVRYPIVNWDYQLHGRMKMKDMEAYKLTRADGTVSFHGGVHSMFLTNTPMEINMLVEKKYPLKKEILEKMINLKLQAKEESTIAFELIKFTRSQIKEKQ